MNIPISSRRDRSHYTLSDALDEIALAEAILDGMKAKPGVTPWGRIASIKDHWKPRSVT